MTELIFFAVITCFLSNLNRFLLYSYSLNKSIKNYPLKEYCRSLTPSYNPYIGKSLLGMTNIREVLATNLRKHRHARGWSQAKLAEKVGTSTQYIGTLEIKGKFPSSEMVHKLASALGIDPTELFHKMTDPETAIRNSKRAAIEDIGESVNKLVTDFFSKKIRELNDKPSEDKTS